MTTKGKSTIMEIQASPKERDDTGMLQHSEYPHEDDNVNNRSNNSDTQNENKIMPDPVFHKEEHCSHDSDQPLMLAKNIPIAPPPPRDILIGPFIVVLMSFVILVFTVVSVGIPWYRYRQYKPTATGKSIEKLFYLFKQTTKEEGSPMITTHPSDLCAAVRNRLRALQGFAIVSSAMTFLMFIFSIVNFIYGANKRSLHCVAAVFAACAFASLTIEVSFNFNIFLWTFTSCGPNSSYHSQLYEPYVGFGLTVTAWVLSMLAGIIISNEFTIPADARTVDKCIHMSTFLSLIAMLFSVISCPISQWFYKDEETSKATDVLLFRTKVGRFAWDLDAPDGHVSTWVKNYDCKPLQRYFYAAQAFSIIAIAFNAGAGATNLLLCENLVGTRLPALILCYIGAVMTLVQVAIELRIYYGNWCNGKYAYEKYYYTLTAGFGLAATAFCLMCFASAASTVAYILTEKYFPAKKPVKSAKQIIIEEAQ